MREVDAEMAGIVLGAAADLPQQLAVTDDRPSVPGQKPDNGYPLTQQSVCGEGGHLQAAEDGAYRQGADREAQI